VDETDAVGDPFEALGNAHRRVIVQLLSRSPRSVGDLADEQVGTRRLYRLQARGLEAVRGYLEEVWGDAATRFRLFAENTPGPGADDG
jgi:hypothetical protein